MGHVHVVIDLHDFYFQTEGGDNLWFPIPYSPKIFKVENFYGSKYSSIATIIFSHRISSS